MTRGGRGHAKNDDGIPKDAVLGPQCRRRPEAASQKRKRMPAATLLPLPATAGVTLASPAVVRSCM